MIIIELLRVGENIMSPKISIVVPVYNDEAYLSRAIESIVGQVEKEIEIIIVDDGSTDKSRSIAERYSASDKRIRVIHKERGGQSSARLVGVSIAKGEYIGFVDGDDYVDTCMFGCMYSIAIETNCDLLSTGIIREYPDGERKMVFDHYDEGLMDDLQHNLYPTMLYNFQENDFGLYCTLVNKLFRRTLLQNVLESIDTRIMYGEDAATLYRYCMKCNTVFINKHAYYHYCIRDDSTSQLKTLDMAINTYALFNSLYADFYDNALSYDLLRQLKRYIINIELHAMELLYGINQGTLNTWDFPYSTCLFEKKFVIYGAGACGQALFRYIQFEKKDRNLVAWIDKRNVDMQQQCDYPLDSIMDGLKKQYEYLFIAVQSKGKMESIKEELTTQYGVDERKIIWEEPLVHSLSEHMMR